MGLIDMHQFTKTVLSSEYAPSFSLDNYLLHLAWFLHLLGFNIGSRMLLIFILY